MFAASVIFIFFPLPLGMGCSCNPALWRKRGVQTEGKIDGGRTSEAQPSAEPRETVYFF